MHPESFEKIEDEALAWLMRSTSGEFTAREAELLQQWLAQSDAHRQAYAEAEQLWKGLGELRDSPVLAERVSQAPIFAQNNQPITKSDFVTAPIARRSTRFRHVSFAAAACIVFLTIVFNFYPGVFNYWLAEHHTATGEQRTLTLADGSVIYLNSASALDTHYSHGRRRIELIAGEAEFIIAKDPGRPFIVATGGQEIKALGTDFIVKKQNGGVRVTVIESAVQITQPGKPDIPKIILRPGERVDAVVGQAPSNLVSVDIDRAQAWRNNRLIFENEPLDTVVAEINRYRPGYVMLSGHALANYRVSGVFHIDQIDNVLAVIDQTLPVKSLALGRRYVLLY